MDILMRLGDFKFSMYTAAYQKLVRSTEYHWPTQDRLWSAPAVQFTGLGSETIAFDGLIVPLFYAGLGQMDALRTLAEAPLYGRSEPMALVSGYGQMLGYFVITKITENQDAILAQGAPGSQSFTLELKRYTKDEHG